MKIAFVAFDLLRFTFLQGLHKGLKDRGHNVRLFVENDRTGTHTKCRWMSFDLRELVNFEPDRVIIFNGYAPEAAAATSWLSHRYTTYFVERGWLPQHQHVYVDGIGLGGRSSLAQRSLVFPNATKSQIEDSWNYLKGIYKPKENFDGRDYILVPLQVEKDTQITLDSPFFKTMNSLIQYVDFHFYDQRIVVKTHPHGAMPVVNSRIRVVTDVDMNSLAAKAKAIVGINSTSLIEGLVHEKPTLYMGRGVLSGSGDGIFLRDIAMPRRLLDWKPDVDDIKGALYSLLHTQFHLDKPPTNVLEYIESGKEVMV